MVYSQPSISTDSASVDSTNCRLKILKGKKTQNVPQKAKLEFAICLATIYIAFTLY